MYWRTGTDTAKIAIALAQMGPAGAASGTKPTSLQKLDAYCDASFAFYDAVVETSKDESLMHSAQRLTSNALDRIGVIRQLSPGE